MSSTTLGKHIQTSRESLKQAVPWLVHVARLYRLLLNQARFPIAAAILDWHGKVQDGPFTGMRFPRSGTGNFSEILGTYELSLIPIIEQVIAREPDVIIDVGAAWGYYAMGFVWRCPTAKVVAYEMDRTRSDLMKKYVRINKLLDRIEVRGRCTIKSLQDDLTQATGAFIFMDVEGAEDELLQPDIPNIDKSEILVELHEIFIPGITGRLESRFAKTHTIRLIEQADLTHNRPSAAFRQTINPIVLHYWSSLIMEDRKQPMAWMHLVPRSSGMGRQL